MPKPTMADVARSAGVDVSTVSRALNARTAGVLRPETVARVMHAAAELGYQPNVLARGLRTQRSATVGMVLPDLTNPFFPPIVRGAEEVLAMEEYTLILANTDNDPERERRVLQSLRSRQVDGLLLAVSHLEEAAADPETLKGVPVVLVNRRTARGDLPAVVADDRRGVELVVQHLLQLGHRRIGHVAGPQDTSTGRDRLESFRQACAAAGVDDAELVELTDAFSLEAGQEACARLLSRRSDVTAILAANDLLAIGCLQTLRERGVRVPADVSLVGFNDMMLVDLIDPPLTTVRVPQYEMGRQAGRMLLQQLRHADGEGAVTVVVHPELIVRASTASPPQHR